MTLRAAALLLVASIVACTIKPGPPPRPPGPRVFPVPVGAKGAVVYAELAVTPRERERGLGGRERLEPDHGMLFVYEFDMSHRFWMKDCLIGLDIAFIDSRGRIANVVTMPPGAGMPDARLPRAESAAPTQYVLEAADGWFARHGIVAGDQADLRAALAGLSR